MKSQLLLLKTELKEKQHRVNDFISFILSNCFGGCFFLCGALSTYLSLITLYNNTGDEMKQTIYVDVLVIINVYVNYGLLLLTALAVRINGERMRILLASLFGGVYSLIILIPGMNETVISLSRIPAVFLMVWLAFGYDGIKNFVRCASVFIGISMLLAGAMFALWVYICPDNMYFNSGIVYFDINALTLILLTVGVYAFIRIISIFFKSKVPHNFTYFMKLYIDGEEISCRAFHDTGNCLKDPFSGEGVIIVDFDVVKKVISEKVFDSFENINDTSRIRFIPVRSVSGNGLMPSFRAEKIILKGAEEAFSFDKPIIALCREKIFGGEYGALLYSDIFEKKINSEGESYALHN